MRILVAIANHGTKNRAYLDTLLRAYRDMSHEVDIVVLSDRPKRDLGDDIEVRVGAPTSNPWSLPFAHRILFAERMNDYDLFIYSEDDTLIEQRHVDAFLAANAALPPHEVPGFMRYEIDQEGQRWICSVHSHYRWDPASVSRSGDDCFASFQNEHSACYILTRDQLWHAISSGEFLVDPHEGEYDMLVSAATDPYTRCGLTRRICISRMDDFLLHHLPNVYLGRLGVSAEEFQLQLQALRRIGRGEIGSDELINPRSALPTPVWDMPCYVRACTELRLMADELPGRVLSLGCTNGALERELFGDEREISGIPLDQVFATLARARGIRTTVPHLDHALQELAAERFDVVFIHQTLHHFEDPVAVLSRLRERMLPAGTLIVVAPNLAHHRLKRSLGRSRVPLPVSFTEHGVHATSSGILCRWLQAAGYAPIAAQHHAQGRSATLHGLLPNLLGPLLGNTAIVAATPAGH